jgi:thiamine kinase-like enzyme
LRYQAFSEHNSDGFSKIVSSSNWIYPESLENRHSRINFGLRKISNSVNIDHYINDYLILKIVSNGILVLDTYNKCVWKGQSCEFEPNFISNHVNSNLYYPKLSLRIIDVKLNLNGFNFIKIPFLDNSLRQSKLLENFYTTKVKKDIYLKSINTLKFKSISQFNQDLLNNKATFEFIPGYLHLHKKSLLSLSDALGKFINSIPARKHFDIAFRFSHGDLMPSNFLRNEQSIFLTDWDNGGMHSYFYDLLIKYIYQKHSVFWKILFSKKIPEFFVKIYVFILFQSTIKLLNARNKKGITLEQFRIYVIIAIYEYYFKNYIRYNHVNGESEGDLVLGNIGELVISGISFLNRSK